MRFTASALLVSLASAPAFAAIYENSIAVDDEEDLFELEQRGDISEETLDTLVELIQEGVDLNSANREELYDLPGITYEDVDAVLEYRKARGRIEDPVELVGANALTAEQLVQISPFIRIDAARPLLPVSGKIHAAARFTATDTAPPPAMLLARLKGPANLSAGFMMFTTRRRGATPTYSPLNDWLTSEGLTYQPHLPRVFAMWKPGNAKLVVGTFTIGFAERLTLDNSRRVTPRGIYLVDDYRRMNDLSRSCRLTANGDPVSPGCEDPNLYITPDYKWRETFRGVAGSIEDLKVGDEASLSLYAFASYQQRSIYQYELFDRRICADPRSDSEECTSPDIHLQDSATTIKQTTFSNVFDELTGGGHVTFKPTYRFTFGVTGFAAMPFFRQAPLQLDFQEYSRYPTGGAFGAIGLDAHTSYKGFNFFLEATHNFDGRFGAAGGGGYGVEQRTTYSLKHQEFELSLRLYDPGFGTPYARPLASPDMLEGQRARNEAGARFSWMSRFSKDWEARLRANFWVNPWAVFNRPLAPGEEPQPQDIKTRAGMPSLYLTGRIDFTGWTVFQPSLFVDIRNSDLASAVPQGCTGQEDDETGQVTYATACGGDLYKIGARFDITPLRKLLAASVQTTFSWKGSHNDFQVWAEIRSRPVDFLQFRVRSRYLNQDIADNASLEQSSWTFLEAAWVISKGTRLGVRYDLYVWLDQRESTRTRRVPNPENRFQLDFRAAF